MIQISLAEERIKSLVIHYDARDKSLLPRSLSYLTRSIVSDIQSVGGGLLMEMKLELVGIPVTDVDRARDFYKISWVLI